MVYYFNWQTPPLVFSNFLILRPSFLEDIVSENSKSRHE